MEQSGTVSECSIHVQRMPPLRPGESLEFALSYPPTELASSRTAEQGVLLCSPQPFLGGDLDNNVVRELAATIARAGRPAVRFNYRAVGRSHDVATHASRFEYWRSVEETGERAAVHADAEQAYLRAGRWFAVSAIAGYSFGAYVAASLAATHAPTLPLALVAPPFTKVDLSVLSTHSGPQLIVVAGKDALDPAPAIDVIQHRFPRARVVRFEDADHFFRGDESRVAAEVREFLNVHLAGEPGGSS